jgi:hypothetical protein
MVGMVNNGCGMNGSAWSTLIAAAGDTSRDNFSDESMFMWHEAQVSNQFSNLYRNIILFDTSKIPDTDSVDSATLSVYGTGKADGSSNAPSINIYSSNPASNTALANGDFDSLGSTPFSTAITYSGWSTSGYNDFTLNASGVAAITNSGVSKFGVRNANYDAAGVAPTWTAPCTSHYINGYMADQSGTANDPKLIVQRTAPTVKGYAVRKPSTQSTASDTVTDDDSALTVELNAGKTYTVHGVIFASSSSQVPDLKVAFTVPSGAEMDLAVVPSSAEQAEHLQTSNVDSDGIPIAANIPAVIQVAGTVKMGSTAGRLNFQWAQNTSDATSVGVLRGSYLRAEEI